MTAHETDNRNLFQDFFEYAVDLWQRNVLFLDVLRQRGDQFNAHMAGKAPTVLSFDAETVLDGATLPRPVNYSLLRVIPPEGVTIDPRKRPFLIVDPRAGHGPGIGGFKPESEIGVALRAGHACYFASFLPYPVAGQTVLDVAHAELAFIEQIIARHPQAEGRPVVIGNCQAGWQVIMAATLRPKLFGPIILAGAPLSYWAGERGGPPMRYTGGLLGGSWLTALTGDLGNGRFDGSWLVANFEGLDPANTYWSKQYNVHAHIDTEPARYLGFEKWWNGHVVLNAGEMQYIVDNLFIGNRLATAEMTDEHGRRMDLRNIRTPILVFCSKGDNITPPAQALGWITDLYENLDDIRSHGQTIIYAIHDSIGHLGIFVSGKVAQKEHEEFASNIDYIDILPPGLYEAVITDEDPGEGALYNLEFVGRTLDDIRAIVKPNPEDEQRFAAVRNLSRVNLSLYRAFAQPVVQALVTEPVSQALHALQPLRLSYEFFSSRNPFLSALEPLAEQMRKHRRPTDKDNLFRTAEGQVSSDIVRALDDWRDYTNIFSENLFIDVYGQKRLQTLVGLQPGEPPRRRPGDDPDHMELLRLRIAELCAHVDKGGPREAVLRAVIYIALAERRADERGFAQLRSLFEEEGQEFSLAEFKRDVREQFLIMLVEPLRAVEAIAVLLAEATPQEIAERLEEVRRVVRADGSLNAEATERLREIETVFERARGEQG